MELLDQKISQQQKSKVLVVDDNPLVQDVLTNLLQSEDYEVVTSDNGEDAVDALSVNGADIIICDVMMPKMDGHMFYSLLQQSEEFNEIPFIFLTALGESSDKQKGRESGADAYLVKPFDPQELLAAVRGRLKKKKRQVSKVTAKVDLVRNQIIRQLTHELRTPLVSVKTGSEFLMQEKGNLSKDKLDSLLSSIWRGGKRLEALVTNFVLLQRIQSGQAKSNYQQNAQDLKYLDWLQYYVLRKQQELEETGFILNYQNQAEDGVVNVCEQHLEMILDRLIDNAVKFSGELKEIDIRALTKDDRLEISIRDHGAGVARESLPRLGEIFYQHNREKNEQQGVGLGLAIAKFLTRINQGRIIIENATSENSTDGAIVKLSFAI